MKRNLLAVAVANVALGLTGAMASAQVLGTPLSTFVGNSTIPGYLAPNIYPWLGGGTGSFTGSVYNINGAGANMDTVRGMAYNTATGNLLVVSRAGGTTIRVLNGTTGAEVGTLNFNDANGTNVVTGGTFLLNQIAVSSDGVVYAGNLTTNSTTSPFKVYRWASDSLTASPSNVYSGDGGVAGARLGDMFSQFLGTDATGTFAVGHSNAPAVSNTMTVFSTTGNSTTAPTIVNPPIPTGGVNFGSTRLGITPINKDLFLTRTTDAFARIVSVTNGVQGTISMLPAVGGNNTDRALAYKEINGFKLVAGIDPSLPNTRIFDIGDITLAGVQSVAEIGIVRTAPSSATNVANGNQSSAIAWGASSGRTATLYSMAANKGIQAFSLTIPYKSGWAFDVDGTYNTGSNWTTGVAPDQGGDIAVFGSVISTARTVSVTTPVSVREMRFDSPNSYTVQGGSVTLTGSTNGPSATLRVIQGNHSITNDLVATTGVLAVIPSGSTLTVNRLDGDGRTLNLLSTTGTLKVTDLVSMDGLTMPAADNGAKIDLTSGGMAVVRQFVAGYSLTGDAALREMVRTWFNGGSKDGNGITSSVAQATAFTTLAVFPNNLDADPATRYFATYRGIDVFASQTLIAYTYIGDTNLDGRVDALDTANLIESLSIGGRSGWANGDLNYDGAIDLTDWGLLQASLGAGLAPLAIGTETSVGGSGAIPEPSALGLLALAVPALSRRRR